jgi:MarR family transcriptional regulator, lower aerobic nicotinate degradation pathway regulator
MIQCVKETMQNSRNRDRKHLQAAPGVLIRRVHQIHLAIYAQKCAEFGTTPVQSSIMQVLLTRPGID